MNHTQNLPRFTFEGLDVWQVMLETIELAHNVVAGLPPKSGELADQIRRASQSMAANWPRGWARRERIAEGTTATSSDWTSLVAPHAFKMTAGFTWPPIVILFALGT